MLVAMTLPAIAGGYMMAKSPDNRMMKANRKRLFRGDISDDDDEPWKDDDDMRD